MKKQTEDSPYLFKTVQSLGMPSVFPLKVAGKLSVAVQFIIPGFRCNEKDREFLNEIAHKCEADVFGINTAPVENKITKDRATLVTVAFYLPTSKTEGDQSKGQIRFKSRLLAERFVGLLSFFAGIKLSAIQIQPTILENGNYILILPAAHRAHVPEIRIQLPNSFGIVPSDVTFSALSWLRRGLAERDPIETFSAFMVCLQIIARQTVDHKPIENVCPQCGCKIDMREPSITSLMRELVVSKLGASQQLFDDIWKIRNAVTAHGNIPITPEILLQLTELKFEAAKLAFQGVKLSLGIPLDTPFSPNQAFSITDAFMYVD